MRRCLGDRGPADGGSSNGRTADSDSASLGSNPSPPASLFNSLVALDGPLRLFGSNVRTLAYSCRDQGLLLGSAANQPAIDRDHSARHIVGQIGREEFDELGAVLYRPELPKRD